MKKFAKIIFVYLLCWVESECGITLEKYVTLCKRNDPDRDGCFIKAFNNFIPKLKDGIPDLNLRPIDPLHIDSVRIDLGNSTSQFELILSDMYLHGLQYMTAKKAHVDLDNARFEVVTFIPNLEIVAKYRARGKILLFEVDSSGSYNSNMTEMYATISSNGKKTSRNGKQYNIYDDLDVEIDIKKLNLRLTNLLPREDLTENLNRALNDNIDVLYNDIKPVIIETLRALNLEFLNKVHNVYAVEELYPE